ncbi:DNA-formamidopyrimidine glycosylase [Mycoplasmopsis californica]|uniref:DNA-formamidopyrimidine glycosylase n=1 Tax=Mycoplasmopsis equigenitalium TaxID=114883 RepID=A0ABY5J1R5_9BACT|nr:DNA-formamidopyrimidine glycosylase [Mycoplasmopsis equigenitalium]UUD37159.1 DNA-formamidopyrimidine glycosylase [Mycoplasmopsis equigenitalium]VEU69535.1 DNA-formamidopyrimidine glycosylase [Mycoplasmopsis californica]
MPELPEVRVVVKSLKEKVLNKKIIKVNVLNNKFIKEISSDEFISKLENAIIKDIINIGKFIVFKLSNNFVVLSHLRMEGKYSFFTYKEPLYRHNYLTFDFSDGTQLRYSDSRMFGTFHLRTIDNYLSILPLSKLARIPSETNVDELYNKIKNRSTAIKTLLLDQTLVLGIGNIYANESLWSAKILPTRSAKSISKEELNTILKEATRIMDASTELGGTTISSYESLNHKQGEFQAFLKVHGKEKKSCPNCYKLIEKIKVNGRGTYFCKTCQK